MPPFLQQIAGHLQENFEGNYENIAVILPTQRSKYFLINELSKTIQKPVFLPDITTISDFIGRMSPFQTISKGELLIELYTAYSLLEQSKQEDFSKFVSWGTMFLQDINDIDMQLKNAKEIFTNLSEIKEIDITLFKDEKDKESKKQKYIEFYLSLGNLYDTLQQSLKEKGVGYSGMIYRDVAENISTYSEKRNFKKYIFVGFNAFTPAEATIVRHYIEHYKAEIFFDLDTFYYDQNIPATLPPYSRNISDLIHLTLKRLNLSERDVRFVGNNYRETTGKQIAVTGLPKGFHQVQHAATLLKTMNYDLDKTAVIFADENLIVPFLHSYDCSKANLTMGYPIQGLPVFNLLQIAIQLIKNGSRMSEDRQKLKFYHKDLLAFFGHPIISTRLFQSETAHGDFVSSFVSMNAIMVSAEEIASFITDSQYTSESFKNEIVEFIGQIAPTGMASLKALRMLFESLAAPNEQKNSQEQSLFSLISSNLSEVENLLHRFPDTVVVPIETAELFIDSQFGGITVPVKGSRDKGLQVMGLLETRTLDFDNIIMLSVNEGNLPIGKTQNSLIIYEVRKHFGLPTYHEKEMVSAYHFFRLLQRAKNIHLIYDNDTRDSLREKSRFINQLKFENLRQKAGFIFTEQTVSLQPSLKTGGQMLEIQKNENIIGEMRNMKYSPTKLTTYITCPLKFYLKHIAKIVPPQNINEDIDSSIIGTVVHYILQNIFIELKSLSETKTSLSESDIENVFNNTTENMDEKLKKAFKVALEDKKIKEIDLSYGKPFLTKAICRNYIKAYLPVFKKECTAIKEFTNAEDKYETTIKVGEYNITLEGIIDRVERKTDGFVYILDYKTGKTEKNDIIKFDIEEITKEEKYKQPLQLLTYAYLLNGNLPASTPPYRCGIVSLQSAATNNECTFSFEVDKELLDIFSKKLVSLFEEIFNSEISFTQTEDDKHCKWCDYNVICGRGSSEN